MSDYLSPPKTVERLSKAAEQPHQDSPQQYLASYNIDLTDSLEVEICGDDLPKAPEAKGETAANGCGEDYLFVTRTGETADVDDEHGPTAMARKRAYSEASSESSAEIAAHSDSPLGSVKRRHVEVACGGVEERPVSGESTNAARNHEGMCTRCRTVVQ